LKRLTDFLEENYEEALLLTGEILQNKENTFAFDTHQYHHTTENLEIRTKVNTEKIAETTKTMADLAVSNKDSEELDDKDNSSSDNIVEEEDTEFIANLAKSMNKKISTNLNKKDKSDTEDKLKTNKKTKTKADIDVTKANPKTIKKKANITEDKGDKSPDYMDELDE